MGRANDCRLYVGRLSHRTRERDLDRLFAPFGKIREILLKAGFAFVASSKIGLFTLDLLRHIGINKYLTIFSSLLPVIL